MKKFQSRLEYTVETVKKVDINTLRVDISMLAIDAHTGAIYSPVMSREFEKKADWDVGIAIDAIELAPKLDVVVLVSGDGDYIPLVEHLKRALGCKVEVLAFGRSCSGKLKEACDEFVDLDHGKKFILNR